jgi:5-formyltetrahydrofolate cyclo-ligase
MSSPLIAPNPQKALLRATALAARDALSGEHRAAAAQAVAMRGLPFEIAPNAIVAGYAAIRSEIDPFPLMGRLAAQRAQLALPVIMARDQPLQFRVWAPGSALRRGPLGILEPPLEAGEITPDILLVPLVAFDRAGHRIGFGAGYYDMTINALRAKKAITAIGVAFATQEIPQVPATERDARLDLVLTERELIDFRM